MKRAVICDLDGPVLDCRKRHHRCYSAVMKALGRKPLGLRAYWEMKKRAVPQTKKFIERWTALIERPEMLKLDRVYPAARRKLKAWRAERRTVVLVTMRRSAGALRRQLKEKGLVGYFGRVVVTRHAHGAAGKVRGLKKARPGLKPRDCVWVGDSEIDIEAARKFGCRSWFVSCGVRNVSALGRKPDRISRDLGGVRP